ncbi:hypothetical protein ACUIAK_09600 [Bacillus cytotoxicus]
MAKTEITVEMERQIYSATTCNQGVFGCFEVTIGWFGKERVDYLTYDTRGFGVAMRLKYHCPILEVKRIKPLWDILIIM